MTDGPADGLAAGLDPRLARVLVALGASGLLIAIALAAASLLVIGPIVGSAASLDAQRGSAIDSLDGAADTIDAMATAAADAGSSLAQSETSLRGAAAVTGQLADALAGLASLSGAFADTASRSRTLSDDLARTADSLGANHADSVAVADRLEALSARVRELRASLAAPTAGGALTGPLGPGVLLVLVLLLVGWIGALASACLWLGRQALRGRLPRSGLRSGVDSPPPINRY